MKLSFFIVSVLLVSCSSTESKKDSISPTPIPPSDSQKTVSVDSFYLDQQEINSNEWKEYQTPYGLAIKAALENESIDTYFKDIFLQEKLIPADDAKMLTVTDSLFSNNPKSDLFYFLVFTKSMNGSDGFYSEALGTSAYSFIEEKTEYFADYFSIAPNLTEKDMDNWAYYIFGEICISRENHEKEAIAELETIALQNIKESRKEYRFVVERLFDKIRSVKKG